MPAEEIERAALLAAPEELDGSLDGLREPVDVEDADMAPTHTSWMGCWPDGEARLTRGTADRPSAAVCREQSLELGGEYGRPDIRMRNENSAGIFVCAIENSVWASDGEGHLAWRLKGPDRGDSLSAFPCSDPCLDYALTGRPATVSKADRDAAGEILAPAVSKHTSTIGS